MKTLLYTLVIITLVSTLTSCTADEIEPAKPAQTTATDLGSDIIPPPVPPSTPR